MDIKLWSKLECMVIISTIIVHSGKSVDNKMANGCFPLYAFRQCDESKMCPITESTQHIYQYHKTPQSISVNFSCSHNRQINIKKVTYLLPSVQNSTCLFTRGNTNQEKCTTQNKCKCCTDKKRLKNKSFLCVIQPKEGINWKTKCQSKQGNCHLRVPRLEMSQACHNNLDYLCNTSHNASKCYSRWVEIMYSCESVLGW